ncbi:MAG: tail fiber domain-containing protein [bacterium]
MGLSVFKQHKKLLFSLAFFAVFSLSLHIFAAPPTNPYSQGETLDPTCTPGSTNCIVSIIPDQTGNSGKYLTTDGTTASWATLSGSGISSLNGLTGSTQTFASSTTGTDFSITSSGSVHTFNLPSASATARGLVTTGTQTFAGAKTFSSDLSVNGINVGATSGFLNTVLGKNTMASSTDGQQSIAIGANALSGADHFVNNIAIGNNALRNASSSQANIGIGSDALYSTTGNSNIAIGASALRSNTSGYYNVAVGVEALYSNTTNSDSIGVGYRALKNATGIQNVALGWEAGKLITTGQYNVIIGGYDGSGIATSNNNIILADGYGNIRMQVDGNGNIDFKGPVTINGGNIGGGSWGGITGTISSQTDLQNALNAKQDALPSLQAGSVLFFDGTSIAEDSNNFFWDDSNNFLGIGTNTPTSNLHIAGINQTNSQARIGSIELQTYAVNNAWLGENVYFNGTNFVARETGTGGLFYFAGDEGQFRFKTALNAGDSWGSGFANFKVNADGTVALGGTGMSVTNGNYTGATLVATGSGKVGIGTTTPDAALTVNSPGSNPLFAAVLVTGGGNIVLGGNGGNSPTINLYPNISNTGSYASSYYNANDDAFYLQTVGLGTSDIVLRNFDTGAKVVMNENGYFGIGDATPNSLLTVGTNDAFEVDASGNISTDGTLSVGGTAFAVDVNGTITSATGLTSSGAITFSGLNISSGAGDVVCINGSNTLSRDNSGSCAVSSQRFKHDIVSLPLNALDTVNALRPVNFKYNGTDKLRTGFIAEEVEKVNKDYVVYEADGVTPHGVYYIDMIPLLAKSIQELDLKITPITSLDVANPNSLGSLVKQFLANTQNTILDLYAQIIHADRVETKQLCIGQTCVDENQLKQLLQQQGGGNAPVTNGGNSPVDETVQTGEESAPLVTPPTPEAVPQTENAPQNDTPVPAE